ncbi:MAG: hypothetical protein QM813_01840 [Verrucomicrobiota bacterium]
MDHPALSSKGFATWQRQCWHQLERMAATTHWTAADSPKNGSPRDKLGLAVKLATLAAAASSQHQPWQFQLSDQFVEVSAAPLTAWDSAPDERTAMIHSGTALQHLKLALKRCHCFGRVELFPDLDRPNLAARVHPGGSGARDEYEQQLSAALEVGEIDSPRLETPSNAMTLTALNQAMPGERGWLEFARSDTSRQRLMELLKTSSHKQVKAIQRQNETLVQSPDGMWESVGFTGTTLHERFSRWRRPTPAGKMRAAPSPNQAISTPNDLDAATGTFAVLKTKTDDKHGWLAAGQMLARLLLQARTLGLACTPFLDVLQRPELRAELRTAIGHKGFTQVILSFTGLYIEAPIPSVAHYPTTATGSAT